MKKEENKNDQDYSKCVQDDSFVHYFKRDFMGNEKFLVLKVWKR